MDTTCKVSAIVVLASLAGSVIANPILIADSVSDFSGVQGQNGWSYGWYSSENVNAGSGFSVNMPGFNPFSSFEPMTGWWSTDPNSAASTPQSGAVPGTYAVITAELMHPHAALPGANLVAEDLWVSRRWVSNTSGLVTLAGSIAHHDYGGFMVGDGTETHILIDGVAVFSYDVAFQDFAGTSYSFDVNISQGSVIEMIVGAKDDPLFDATRFDMTVTLVPAPGALALIGLGGVFAGGRRRK
ncbi:MAG: PEP-CTERM sorting domain-containing protein [Phycisphaerales bacterium]|nr:PEP-CTERM sorting domain-containing protein [Planctomycetota bacterium]MCH8509073.1 PEP-CTERM sorting domain-containing protein [Phycisphaerales bacterium]